MPCPLPQEVHPVEVGVADDEADDNADGEKKAPMSVKRRWDHPSGIVTRKCRLATWPAGPRRALTRRWRPSDSVPPWQRSNPLQSNQEGGPWGPGRRDHPSGHAMRAGGPPVAYASVLGKTARELKLLEDALAAVGIWLSTSCFRLLGVAPAVR